MPELSAMRASMKTSGTRHRQTFDEAPKSGQRGIDGDFTHARMACNGAVGERAVLARHRMAQELDIAARRPHHGITRTAPDDERRLAESRRDVGGPGVRRQ